MRLLDLTLPTPAENIALDEALLVEAEQGGGELELLRVWESPDPLVVVGRGSAVAREVNVEACWSDDVPIFRRCSGGTAIVAARGCLMYAVVLSYQKHPQLRSIDMAHQFVLSRIAEALARVVPGVVRAGTSDLALQDCKVSGNSLRCRRDFLLYHGTLLYNMPLSLIQQYLRVPPRQPEYRRGRGHDQFVTNLPLDEVAVRDALSAAWEVSDQVTDWPEDCTRELVKSRYAEASWNFQRP
ncbi:MAG: lipoate--protein ligase family protein [Planctomycetota bacterium]|nr:lipoate--protein ligase family protein [Planctomycetota bacterium]